MKRIEIKIKGLRQKEMVFICSKQNGEKIFNYIFKLFGENWKLKE